MRLTVPDLPPDITTLDAALEYARNGWFVGPVAKGTKNPGSVLGKAWENKSTCNPKVIRRLWPGDSERGIFLHAGRSGAILFDVDNPSKLPVALKSAVAECAPPFQSTRVAVAGRGHYVFARPVGVDFSNSIGDLGHGWGEVRGRNGVVIAEPSEHEKSREGGRYYWEQVGTVPLIPSYLAEGLRHPGTQMTPASDAEVVAFYQSHSNVGNIARMSGPLNTMRKRIEADGSRHDAARDTLTWMLREARAGLYSAAEAREAVRAAFLDAVEGE